MSKWQRKQCRRFVECMEDHFPAQLISESTRGGAPLDLLFVTRGGLVGDVFGVVLGRVTTKWQSS